MNSKKLKVRKKLEKIKSNFLLVAIGASAGGLDAFEHFFKKMSPDCNMSFVLITHLDPTHESSLDELISRYTDLEVKVAEDGIQVTPNSIFILPPNRTMSISNGVLSLKEPSEPRGKRLPIDHFFRSLALDQKENALGIIFSGTGSDGTLGLREIKGAGGLAIVQDPESAKYEGMPRSAIQNVRVDLIATPEEIANTLFKFQSNLGEIRSARKDAQVERNITDIFHMLRSNYGQDFSVYKLAMIHRRIERRMIICQISNLSDYVDYISVNSEELDLLFRELLIGVTNFFRDKEAFQKLEDQVVYEIVKQKNRDDTMRIWIPACSTVEEAYSVAIILIEQLNKLNKNLKIQIFATDVDAKAVEKARIGRYPDNIIADIDQDRLAKFFNQYDNAYEIKKELRDKIIFAVQNVITEPPFSKVDLISCRNLLIYLTSEIQNKLITLFHYALNPEGILFLGTSETIGSMTEIFDVIDSKYKIFKKKEIPQYKRDDVNFFPTLFSRFEVKNVEDEGKEKKLGLEELIQREILNRFSPPSIIVDNKNSILYFHGQTGKFLNPPQGMAKMDVVSMAKESLKVELSTSLRKARAKRKDVRINNLQIKQNGDFINLNLIIHPILEPLSMRDLIMVSFEINQFETEDKEKSSPISHDEVSESRVRYLEEELETTKKHLQRTIEELETSNEELKSTNEELQSSNEELQSTNEELQTSKEELQSMNEELIAVNTELEEKIKALAKANNDLSNLMKSTKIATVFLTQDLTIKRFTPEFSNIFNVIESDLGRPISHIVSNLKHLDLIEDIKGILQNLGAMEEEVQAIDGRWYKMKISPYLTEDKKVEGIVLTFSDITIQKQATEAVEFYRDLLIHEINNIFQVISSSAEMVKEKSERNAEVDHFITTISKSVARARKLINNVQKIAEMASSPPDLEPFNFIPILKEIIKRIEEIENKNIKTEVKIENLTGSDDLYVRADPFLSDLLENILLNSIHHNDNTLAEILIKLSGITKNNKYYLKIEFHDNGIGIPDQLKDNVFQRLYHKRKRGIGIGLSVVKRIIERYGGDIWVEDRVLGDYKQGSKFIVLLPLNT
jgi:two-component system CheB/CheR fusion protein